MQPYFERRMSYGKAANYRQIHTIQQIHTMVCIQSHEATMDHQPLTLLRSTGLTPRASFWYTLAPRSNRAYVHSRKSSTAQAKCRGDRLGEEGSDNVLTPHNATSVLFHVWICIVHTLPIEAYAQL